MAIIIDMGDWWIESRHITGFNPLAGASDDIEFLLERAGHVVALNAVHARSTAEPNCSASILTTGGVGDVTLGSQITGFRVRLFNHSAGNETNASVNVFVVMRR